MANQSGRGGARAGAGRPRGSKDPQTLEKEAARSALRQMVLGRLAPLVDAQISNAQGIKYFVLRDKKTGKFTRIGHDHVKLLIESDDPEAFERIEVWEKDPSIQAFTDLMNRAIDKAIEPIEVGLSANLESAILDRILSGRKRLASQ